MSLITPCPKCNGQGGLGTFGPCHTGTLYYKRPCPLCNGTGKIPMGYTTTPCECCETKGGIGAFGPCEVDSINFKTTCKICSGAGYYLIPATQSSVPFPGTYLSHSQIPGVYHIPPLPSILPPGLSLPSLSASQSPSMFLGNPTISSPVPFPPPISSLASSSHFPPIPSTPGSPQSLYLGNLPIPPSPIESAPPSISSTSSSISPLSLSSVSSSSPMTLYPGGPTLSPSSPLPFPPSISPASLFNSSNSIAPFPPSGLIAGGPYPGATPILPGQRYALIPSHAAPTVPPATVQGFQNDLGQLHCAVANSSRGKIPGKAKDRTCWYPYGGKEHITGDFSWVIVPGGYHLEPVNGLPPPNSIPAGFQTDGQGILYCAIAQTIYGNIPGKAKDGICYYSYGGKEHTTSRYMWVCHN